MKEKLLHLINKTDYFEAFQLIKEMGVNRPDLNGLAKEFMMGTYRYDYNFNDRLKVVFQSLDDQLFLASDTSKPTYKGLPSTIDTTDILFIAANPLQGESILLREEFDTINAVFQGQTDFNFQSYLSVTRNKLVELSNLQPKILHFSGHGNQNSILLKGNSNTPEDYLEYDQLKDFISMFNDLDLVILNCCYSSDQALQLSSLGITVIGHFLGVYGQYAVDFSKGFYTAIANQKSYQQAYKMGLFSSPNLREYMGIYKNGQTLDW